MDCDQTVSAIPIVTSRGDPIPTYKKTEPISAEVSRVQFSSDRMLGCRTPNVQRSVCTITALVMSAIRTPPITRGRSGQPVRQQLKRIQDICVRVADDAGHRGESAMGPVGRHQRREGAGFMQRIKSLLVLDN